MSENVHRLVDHLFRHEAGKMVAVLTRIFGLHNLELAEDVMQDAFMKAADSWRYGKIPDNPAAWLMQTARNKAIDLIRRQKHQKEFAADISHLLKSEYTAAGTIKQFFLEHEIRDSSLRLIFACCHPALSKETQVALTLKTVSGFSVKEIAKALVTTEDTVEKRLYRARQQIREEKIGFEIPAGSELKPRLETVYTVLYLLFNEGYNSSKADKLIRDELCEEALRLGVLLTENELCRRPETYALLSLMCLQASRFDSRIDEQGGIVLLREQDRSKWNRALIDKGIEFLNYSAEGETLTAYHVEAGIAAQHCLAESFEATDWKLLLRMYDMLLQLKPTATVLLNRAVALAQAEGHAKALESIFAIDKIEKLIRSQYLFGAVIGELYMQSMDYAKAASYLSIAEQLTPSDAEKRLVQKKIAQCKSAQN